MNSTSSETVELQSALERETARANRLARELEELAQAKEQQRLELGRVTAERDSFSIEARRMTYEWNALAEELRACRRRADVAEGNGLILGAKLRQLEARVLQARGVLAGQPLYRVMVRTGLLKAPELPDAPAQPG